jgi:beta-glucanase (GH16 family)
VGAGVGPPQDGGGADAASTSDAPVVPGPDAGDDAPVQPQPEASAGDGALPGWILTWSDEFDGPNGSAIDPSKWVYDVGDGGSNNKGWGNNELEYYTSGTANAVVQDGSLVITGTPQGASQYTCWYGTCKYTSARVTTKGKFAQQYGRFEARVKVPRGKGVWPAFWMMGDDYPGNDWPACGEIDVMENIGDEPGTVHGTTHGPGPATYVDVGLTGATTLPGGAAFADDFHVFAIEWEAMAVRFYADGALYKTVTPADVPAGATWVWDHAFFMLLNFAIGGDWPGSPDATTSWPQTMRVDYVRVYKKA